MRRPGRIADFAAIGAAFAVALAQSWRRWCDPVIDIGRDLYIPEQLLHGARLYRDIKYYYPPLAPYLLAAITRLTGHSLAAYIAIGIAQSAVVIALLYLTANRIAGRAGAFGAAFAFVCMNMCGASTWGANWIFPYSHPATFGMMFFLAFFACVVYERPALAMAFALFSCFCKIDFILGVAIAVGALLLVKKLRVRHALGLLAAAVVTVVSAAAFFGAAALRENVFPPSLLHTARAARFYSFVSGAAFWRDTLLDAVIGVVAIAVVALLIRRNQRRLAIGVSLIAGLVIPVTWFFRAAGFGQWLTLTRRREAMLFAAGALSIAATIRIAFNVAPVWYGFVLIVPLYLLIAYVTRAEVIWTALLVVLSLRMLDEQRQAYAAKAYPIVTKRGVIFDANADRAAVLNEALPLLHDSVAVFPEGLTLNYFARVPTTLTYQTFTPVETADPAVESDLIREMLTRPPKQVVILSRDVREFGSAGFGVDYNQRLLALIRARYAVERSWSRPHFHLVLLRRQG